MRHFRHLAPVSQVFEVSKVSLSRRDKRDKMDDPKQDHAEPTARRHFVIPEDTEPISIAHMSEDGHMTWFSLH